MEDTADRSRPGEQKKEFFLSSPRSAKIREVCSDALQSLNSLLHNTQIAGNREKRQEVYEDLERSGEQLFDLGIEENMHLGKQLKNFQANPVVFAEFLAGQLLPFTYKDIISDTGVMPLKHDFSTEKLLVQNTVIFVSNSFALREDDPKPVDN